MTSNAGAGTGGAPLREVLALADGLRVQMVTLAPRCSTWESLRGADVIGACNARLRTAWVLRDEALWSPELLPADLEVRSLAEMADALGA